MNLRSRQVWRADRRRYHADTPDDHYRGGPPGEPFLRAARAIFAGAARTPRGTQCCTVVSRLTQR